MDIIDILKKMFSACFPFCDLIKANKIIRTKNESIVQEYDNLSFINFNLYFNLDIDKIIEYYNKSFESKKTIEEKIKTSLISLTLVASFITILANVALSDSFKSLPLISFISVLLIIIIAVAYFVSAGFMSLNAIGEKNRIYIMSLETDSQLQEENERKKHYAALIELNNNTNIIRQNYMCTSYNCIRNGLIAIFIIPLILIPSGYFSTIEKDYITKNEFISLQNDIIVVLRNIGETNRQVKTLNEMSKEIQLLKSDYDSLRKIVLKQSSSVKTSPSHTKQQD